MSLPEHVAENYKDLSETTLEERLANFDLYSLSFWKSHYIANENLDAGRELYQKTQHILLEDCKRTEKIWQDRLMRMYYTYANFV